MRRKKRSGWICGIRISALSSLMTTTARSSRRSSSKASHRKRSTIPPSIRRTKLISSRVLADKARRQRESDMRDGPLALLVAVLDQVAYAGGEFPEHEVIGCACEADQRRRCLRGCLPETQGKCRVPEGADVVTGFEYRQLHA